VPKIQIGEVYIHLATALNPFEKKYAKVLATQSGYVQFKTGKAPDFTPSGPKSLTEKKFMAAYGPQ
jgi:hypothetical protein